MTTRIPKKCLSCRFEVFVNFGKVFRLFLGAFIVDFEYSVFIVNDFKCYRIWHIFIEHQVDVILMGVFAKH